MKEKLKHFLYIAIALVIIEVAFNWHGLNALLRGYSLHLLAAVLAVTFSALIFLASLRTEVFILSHQQERTPDKLRRPLGLFMRYRLEELDKIRTALYSPEGLFLTDQELGQLVPACFDANSGKQYVGTDSSVPSEFYIRYPTYLDQHIEKKGKWRRIGFHQVAHDFRVLLVTEQDLRNDFANEEKLFREFVKGHEDHGIRLYQIDPLLAQKLANAHQLPATDFGLFGGRFVVYFIPPTDEQLLVGDKSSDGHDPSLDYRKTLQFRIFMESLNARNRFNLRRYLGMLNSDAKEIKIENTRVVCKERSDEEKREDLKQIHWITKSFKERMNTLEQNERS